jgi:hypothetical protein
MEIIDHESSGITVPSAIWLAVSLIGPLLPWSDYAVFAMAAVIGYWPPIALWAAIPLVTIWIAAKRIVQHRYWTAASFLLLSSVAIVASGDFTSGEPCE